MEELLGDPVVESRIQPGGFSPGVAVRVGTRGGRRAFVKAVSESLNAVTASMHRKEAGITTMLAGQPFVPRLLGHLEVGDWVVLVLEEIDGVHPDLPWRDDQLDQVLVGLDAIAARLTPAPPEALGLPTCAQDGPGHDRPWRQLRDDPGRARRLGHPFAEAHLDRLAELEQDLDAALQGESLVHTDLRADQILLTPRGLVLVDWPHARRGAAWLDPLFMLPSVVLQGGPALGELVARSRLLREAPPDALRTAAVGLAGFFMNSCLNPPPPAIPTVRDFQRAQGEVVLEWLAGRLGLG